MEQSEFVRKLLSRPGPALAWACEAASDPDLQQEALAILLHPMDGVGDFALAQHRARCRALGEPSMRKALLEKLPSVWAAQQDSGSGCYLGALSPCKGVAAWIDVLCRLKDSGVDAEESSIWAARAAASPVFEKALSEIEPAVAKEVFGRVACRQGCPDELGAAFAKALDPWESALALSKWLFSDSGTYASGLRGVEEAKGCGPKMAKALAAQALSDPKSARLLLGQILFSIPRLQKSKNLRGLFEALAEAPGFKMHPLPLDASGKELDGPYAKSGGLTPKSAGAIAMWLLCHGEQESAQAAFGWAASLGYKGQGVPATITDGVATRRLDFAVPVHCYSTSSIFGGDRPQEVSFSTRLPMAAALFSRKIDFERFCEATRFGRLSKDEYKAAHELAKRAAERHFPSQKQPDRDATTAAIAKAQANWTRWQLSEDLPGGYDLSLQAAKARARI